MRYCSSFLYRLLRGVSISSAVREMFQPSPRSFGRRGSARSLTSLNSRSVRASSGARPAGARTARRPGAPSCTAAERRSLVARRHDHAAARPSCATLARCPASAGGRARSIAASVNALRTEVALAREQPGEVAHEHRDILRCGPAAAGRGSGCTLSRKYRSSRKAPALDGLHRGPCSSPPAPARPRFIVRADPRRSTSPSCRTRSTFACVFGASCRRPRRGRWSRDPPARTCRPASPWRRVNEPLLVPEELRLDQIVGDCGAVDLHEALARRGGCCGGSPVRPAPSPRRSRPESGPRSAPERRA